MLQNVASHYTLELGCLTALRTNALKYSSRNYPKIRNTSSKQKFTVQRCKPERILQDVQHPFTDASPPAGARVVMARAKKATLLQTTPRWTQQTLTSVVNGVVPW